MVAVAIAVADFHLTGTAEVIARSHIDVVTQQQVGTHGDMLDEALVPVVEARQGGREAQRRTDEALGDAELQVKGDALEVIIVGSYLSTQILGHGRQRPAAVGVEVVDAEVDCHGSRVIAGDVRRNEACGDATADAVAQQVGKRACQGNIPGREGAHLAVVDGGFLHRAIVHILC